MSSLSFDPFYELRQVYIVTVNIYCTIAARCLCRYVMSHFQKAANRGYFWAILPSIYTNVRRQKKYMSQDLQTLLQYSILNSSVQLTDLANCVIFFKTGFDKFYWQCILSQLLNFIVYTYPPTLTAVLRGCVREQVIHR